MQGIKSPQTISSASRLHLWLEKNKTPAVSSCLQLHSDVLSPAVERTFWCSSRMRAHRPQLPSHFCASSCQPFSKTVRTGWGRAWACCRRSKDSGSDRTVQGAALCPLLTSANAPLAALFPSPHKLPLLGTNRIFANSPVSEAGNLPDISGD